MCDWTILGVPFLQMNQKSRYHLFDSLKQEHNNSSKLGLPYIQVILELWFLN